MASCGADHPLRFDHDGGWSHVGRRTGGERVGEHIEGSTATSSPPPPTQSAIPVPPAAAPRPGEHKPLAMRARVASALVLLVTLIEFVTVPIAVFDYRLYGRVIAGEELSATTWDRVDQVWLVLPGVFLIAFLLSAIAFVAWFHQAYKNLSTYSFVDHRPGWAIGAWFVPFLNLYRPFKIMGELFRRSGLAGDEEHPPHVQRRLSTLTGRCGAALADPHHHPGSGRASGAAVRPSACIALARDECNVRAPPAGFEPALTVPETDALSPELRGPKPVA